MWSARSLVRIRRWVNTQVQPIVFAYLGLGENPTEVAERYVTDMIMKDPYQMTPFGEMVDDVWSRSVSVTRTEKQARMVFAAAWISAVETRKEMHR